MFTSDDILFHLSDGLLGVMHPRVPSSLFEDENGKVLEDSKTPRVCFSTSILGCINAISHRIIWDQMEQNIYALPKKGSKGFVKRPSKRQVFDAPDTGEVWILCPVRPTLVGTLAIKKNQNGAISIRVKVDKDKIQKLKQSSFRDYIVYE